MLFYVNDTKTGMNSSTVPCVCSLTEDYPIPGTECGFVTHYRHNVLPGVLTVTEFAMLRMFVYCCKHFSTYSDSRPYSTHNTLHVFTVHFVLVTCVCSSPEGNSRVKCIQG